jgi:hypothetical protein
VEPDAGAPVSVVIAVFGTGVVTVIGSEVGAVVGAAVGAVVGAAVGAAVGAEVAACAGGGAGSGAGAGFEHDWADAGELAGIGLPPPTHFRAESYVSSGRSKYAKPLDVPNSVFPSERSTLSGNFRAARSFTTKSTQPDANRKATEVPPSMRLFCAGRP